MIRGEHGIQCMPRSSRIIGEMQPEIHTMENVIFSNLLFILNNFILRLKCIKDLERQEKRKRIELAKNINPQGTAFNESHCLLSSLWIVNGILLGGNRFLKFCMRKFCYLLFGALRVKRFHRT